MRESIARHVAKLLATGPPSNRTTPLSARLGLEDDQALRLLARALVRHVSRIADVNTHDEAIASAPGRVTDRGGGPAERDRRCEARVTLLDDAVEVGAPATIRFELDAPPAHPLRADTGGDARLLVVATPADSDGVTPASRLYSLGKEGTPAADFLFTPAMHGIRTLNLTVYDRKFGIPLQEVSAAVPVVIGQRRVAGAVANALRGLRLLGLSVGDIQERPPVEIAASLTDLAPASRFGLTPEEAGTYDRALVVACRQIALHLTAEAEFEERYALDVVRRYDHLTIHGVDLPRTPGSWPLDHAYLSLRCEPADGEGAGPVPVEEALAGLTRILVCGEAGSGKTTLVQWLAVSTVKREPPPQLSHLLGRIPFIVPVRRLPPEGLPPPSDLLTAIGYPGAEAQPTAWMERVLADGRALLLIDGVDEVPQGEQELLETRLEQWLGEYPGNVCLVTARPSALPDDGWLTRLGFSRLRLVPMSRDEVADFVHRWHSAARRDEEDRGRRDRLVELKTYERQLLFSAQIHPGLRDLAANPLMCGVICALNRDRAGSLPHGRKELYDAALEMLLQRRDAERGVVYADDVPQREALEGLLRKLAQAMPKEGASELPRERAGGILDEAMPALPRAGTQGDSEKVFQHLLHRTGLLRERPDEPVTFAHRSLQDYLAAKEIVARGRLHTLVDHAHQPEWYEVIRMAVAHARPDDCADFLERLLEPAPGLLLGKARRRRLMAAACLEHATALDPAVERSVHARTERLVHPTAEPAARVLGWLGPIVLELLPDPEQVRDERQALLLAITATRVQDEAAVDYLARLRDHSALAIREELARAWPNFDTERYAREIIAHLDPDDLYFPVTGPAELRALAALGGRPRVRVAGPMPTEELLAGLDPRPLTHLWIDAEIAGMDAAWLSRFPRLRVLQVDPRLPGVWNVPEGISVEEAQG